MAYLFLDTSDELHWGILGSNLEWVDYSSLKEKKTATKLHSLLYQSLHKADLSLGELSGVCLSAGPGSYTGVRIGEGLAQVLEIGHIPIFSFYHYEVPKILGHHSGAWICPAFKGEFFFYEWKGDTENSGLLSLKELPAFLQHRPLGETLFSQGDLPMDATKSENTNHLIHQKSVPFFQYVISHRHFRNSFYFRSIDNEFKKMEPVG